MTTTTPVLAPVPTAWEGAGPGSRRETAAAHRPHRQTRRSLNRHNGMPKDGTGERMYQKWAGQRWVERCRVVGVVGRKSWWYGGLASHPREGGLLEEGLEREGK